MPLRHDDACNASAAPDYFTANRGRDHYTGDTCRSRRPAFADNVADQNAATMRCLSAPAIVIFKSAIYTD